MKNKAFFIDRDGIISSMVKQEDGYIDSPQQEEEVTLCDGIVEVISWLNNNKIPVIEISNQPGVAKGKLTMEKLEAIEKKVHSLLKGQGVFVDAIYRCFHHPNAVVSEYNVECDCRKPKPGLLIRAAMQMNIDLESSIFLGDNITDIDAGHSAGCHTILYLHTPHPNDTQENLAKNEAYQDTHRISSISETIPTIIKIWHNA